MAYFNTLDDLLNTNYWNTIGNNSLYNLNIIAYDRLSTCYLNKLRNFDYFFTYLGEIIYFRNVVNFLDYFFFAFNNFFNFLFFYTNLNNLVSAYLNSAWFFCDIRNDFFNLLILDYRHNALLFLVNLLYRFNFFTDLYYNLFANLYFNGNFTEFLYND